MIDLLAIAVISAGIVYFVAFGVVIAWLLWRAVTWARR